jgi:hypothetical protein
VKFSSRLHHVERCYVDNFHVIRALLQDNGLLLLLDRDTRRGPRTRVLAVITRRSDHRSLLRTHKPGSPILLCPARTPVPLAQVLTHCRLPFLSGLSKSTNPYPISRDLDPGMSPLTSVHTQSRLRQGRSFF